MTNDNSETALHLGNYHIPFLFLIYKSFYYIFKHLNTIFIELSIYWLSMVLILI
jgi:hypothetical protein